MIQEIEREVETASRELGQIETARRDIQNNIIRHNTILEDLEKEKGTV